MTPAAVAGAGPFSFLSDDIVLNILAKLEADPRDWARLSCVSGRFALLIRTVLYRSKLSRSLPSAAADLLSGDDWASLHKLYVCCPGLVHAGVLLESSDFGLEREIGPDESYRLLSGQSSSDDLSSAARSEASPPGCWSLFDDLYFDTVYDDSESQIPAPAAGADHEPPRRGQEFIRRKRRWLGPVNSHLASGARNLSREQGNKLLASRFRGDSLYICDWPGCVHAEEKRKYMLFRGMFKNFKRSRVWRTINDGNRVKIGLDCAFCACKDTWDLHSSFCLRRFGFHDDGEPVVRAYVCDKGHVSGAWTERPIYT